MKRVNRLGAGAYLLSQTLSGVSYAASITLVGMSVELKLTMQELNHVFKQISF